MFFSAIRILIWISAICYLLQSIYYPFFDLSFGLSYIGNDNFHPMLAATYSRCACVFLSVPIETAVKESHDKLREAGLLGHRGGAPQGAGAEGRRGPRRGEAPPAPVPRGPEVRPAPGDGAGGGRGRGPC